MMCSFQHYSEWRDNQEFQAMVDHSDEKYKCEQKSDCPYTGTTIINKIPWIGEKDLKDLEDLDLDLDLEDSKSNTERKPGLFDKIKKLFRK